MRDFPLFTTQNGAASLFLREIPYWNRAYIKILDTMEPEKLLEECRDFCRAVGAQRVYASGNSCLEKYRLHTVIVEMERSLESLPPTAAKAVTVTQQDLEQWKDIYNRKMKDVPNAAYMDDKAANAMLKDGSGYSVRLDGALIGIGKAAGNTVEALASIRHGAGQDIVLALCKTLEGERVRLTVADSNTRAIALYEQLGFEKKGEICRWYEIV